MTKKVDVYSHFFPDVYAKAMMSINPKYKDLGKRVRGVKMLFDLDARFRCMDKFGDDYRQILTVPMPPPEVLAGADKAVELMKAANDGLAELCEKHPERFAGFAAKVALNNIDASFDEIDRCMKDLGALGIEIATNSAGRPMDLPQFAPIFEKAAKQHDCPIWVHPVRGADNVVFSSDSPFDPEGGEMYIRETIKILDELEIPESTREKIYYKNAERLCNRKFF